MSGRSNTTLKTMAGKGGLTGLGVTFCLTLLRSCLRKPGIQAYLDYLLGHFIPILSVKSAPSPEAARNAEAVAGLFREKGFVPHRLAVDGIPGSGKSSLAKALAERLGMDAVCLDHQDMDQPRDLARSNAIYEHHRLLRTQEIEVFDAIIYIDEPVDVVRERILRRKRGGYLVEILDYDLLKRIGDEAFFRAAGETLFTPDGSLRIKIRPGGGFRDRERLQRELLARGADAGRLAKEEALFLCVEGTPRKGFKAYLNPHAFDKELLDSLTESVFLSGGGKGKRW